MIHPLSYRTGLITGTALIVLYVITYMLGVEAYTNFITPFIIMIAMLVYLIMSTRKIKQSQGQMTFIQGLLNFVTMAAIAVFMSNIFNFLLVYVIDPEFGSAVAETIIEKTIAMMEGFGAPESQIVESVSEMEVEFEKQSTLPGTLWSVVKQVFFWAIPGAIVALVLRTKGNQVSETLD